MIRRLVAALCALALASTAQAQPYLPGVAPGFRSGFQFISGAGGFPASGAVADFDFKNARYSGPAITVSNASGGYVDDAAGNWTLVPPNTARRSNKGLLVEGAQTNVLTYSGDLSQTAWSKYGTTATTFTTGPDGASNSATQLRETTAAASKGIYQTASVTSGNLYTWWAIVRPTAGRSRIGIKAQATATIITAEFDTAAVTATGAGATIKAFSNGWFLISVSATATATGTGYFELVLRDGTGAGSFTGGGSTSAGWDIWNTQLEQWSTSVTTVGVASSPIRTTGTAATRAADVVTATLGNALTAGTIASVHRNPAFAVNGSTIYSLTDGTANNLVFTRNASTGGNTFVADLLVGGTAYNIPGIAGAFPSDGTRHADAYAFASNDLAVSNDGASATTGGGYTLPAGLRTLNIGNVITRNPFFGYIERLAVYPYRAPNGQLQTLSTLQNWGG